MSNTEILIKKALKAIADVAFDITIDKKECVANAEKLIQEARKMLEAIKK